MYDDIIFGDVFDSPRPGFGCIIRVDGDVRNARYIGENGSSSIFELSDGSIRSIDWA